MSDSFKTQKGTEIFYLNLKGKKYLQVADRLMWFREEWPEHRIWTTIVETNEKYSIVRAEIANIDGHILQTAHQQEHASDFRDHLSKAETAAVGRALAMLGYGTQFAQELETPNTQEGPRLADAPRAPKPAPKAAAKVPQPVQQELVSGSKPTIPPIVLNVPTGDLNELVTNIELKTLVREREAAKMSGDELKALVTSMYGDIDPKKMTLSQYKAVIDAIKNRDVP